MLTNWFQLAIYLFRSFISILQTFQNIVLARCLDMVVAHVGTPFYSTIKIQVYKIYDILGCLYPNIVALSKYLLNKELYILLSNYHEVDKLYPSLVIFKIIWSTSYEFRIYKKKIIIKLSCQIVSFCFVN